jgi:hypothetical protein
MSDKEKAEMYMALAKLAYERFDQLADIAWRLRFAVWTAFGLATWFVLASEKWRLRRMECILASLITLGLIATVIFIWGPFQYERSTRLARVAGYWESAVEHAVGGEKLPDHLRRDSLGIGGHTRYSEGWSVDKPLLPWYKNPVYVSNALVTVLFGLLAIGAIVSKTDWQSGSATRNLQGDQLSYEKGQAWPGSISGNEA